MDLKKWLKRIGIDPTPRQSEQMLKLESILPLPLEREREEKRDSTYRDDVGNQYLILDIKEQIQVVTNDYKKLFTFELQNGETIHVSTDIDAVFDKAVGRRFISHSEDANEFIDRDGVIKKVIAARKIEYYGTYDAKVLFILETSEEVIINYVD